MFHTFHARNVQGVSSGYSLYSCAKPWPHASPRYIWGFPKMVVPNNHWFSTKTDHFGVFWGYHHLRKHPYTLRSIPANRRVAPHVTTEPSFFKAAKAKPVAKTSCRKITTRQVVGDQKNFNSLHPKNKSLGQKGKHPKKERLILGWSGFFEG